MLYKNYCITGRGIGCFRSSTTSTRQIKNYEKIYKPIFPCYFILYALGVPKTITNKLSSHLN